MERGVIVLRSQRVRSMYTYFFGHLVCPVFPPYILFPNCRRILSQLCSYICCGVHIFPFYNQGVDDGNVTLEYFKTIRACKDNHCCNQCSLFTNLIPNTKLPSTSIIANISITIQCHLGSSGMDSPCSAFVWHQKWNSLLEQDLMVGKS